MQHAWIPSTLGHGETMCRRCFVTNREAAAVGMTECDVPEPAPASSNDNEPQVAQFSQEQIDDEMLDDDEAAGSEDCGRWDNGRLSLQCSKAGSEECDWHCPIGLPRRASVR